MIIPNSPLLWLKWIFIGNRERQEEFPSVSEPRCVSARDEGAYRSPTFHVSLLLTAVTERRCRRVARGRGAAAAERGWGVPAEAAGLWVAPAQPVPERGDHHVRAGGESHDCCRRRPREAKTAQAEAGRDSRREGPSVSTSPSLANVLLTLFATRASVILILPCFGS